MTAQEHNQEDYREEVEVQYLGELDKAPRELSFVTALCLSFGI